MERVKKAALLNAVLFILEAVAVFWMFSGIAVSKESSSLTESSVRMLKFFTVDSNILAGIAAILAFSEQMQCLKKEKMRESDFCYYIKLAATASVMLTMLTTIFFLAPSMGRRWMTLFRGSNFLFHLINPIIAAIVFLFFEKRRMKCFPATLFGVIPMLLYAFVYMINAFSKAENGTVPLSADWYGFLVLGTKSAGVVLLLITFVTYLISAGLWKLNGIRAESERY